MTRTHILFVDDDVLNHWLVTDSLNAIGFTVTGLCRGARAVEVLEYGGEFDLLLTDLYMPDGMSGFELADHWRRARPGRPILYTGPYPHLATTGLQTDEGYIHKHAATLELLTVIDGLLEGSAEPRRLALDRSVHYLH